MDEIHGIHHLKWKKSLFSIIIYCSHQCDFVPEMAKWFVAAAVEGEVSGSILVKPSPKKIIILFLTILKGKLRN